MKKLIFVFQIIVSLVVIGAAIMQITGLHTKAVNVAVPMVGLMLLLQGIGNWKDNRAAAITGFCCAAFIFAVSIVVFFS